MHSLLARIFLSFWLIIVLTIFTAATFGYLYAERARASLQSFEVSEAMLQASESLRVRGREGLVDWLGTLPSVTASLVFVIDEGGRELLGRRLPPPAELALRRFGKPRGVRPPPGDSANFRPARPFAQLVGPQGEVYTLIVLPAQNAVARWISERGQLTLVLIGLLVSGGVSYLLARAISGPIRRFRESTVAIAAGDLDSRIDRRVEQRRDELGGLAQDFNRMARQLQLAWTRQSELTSNVSHELRSPLARLSVATGLARRKAGDIPELDRIDLETGRLDDLIGQILEFSRLGTSAASEPGRVDLSELVASVVDDVRFERPDTRIELQSDIGVEIDGHREALQSAIENVLRNAAIHGGPSVRVSLSIDGSNVELFVEDHGGGVDDAALESLFEPFYRAQSSGSRGAGLGLAIAARAVHLHGGTIRADNTGGGLQVTIVLPSS